jgi:hypothetical protein
MIDTLSSPNAVDVGSSMKVASGAQRTEAVRQENPARQDPVVPQSGNETVVIDNGRNSQGRIQAQKTAHSDTAGRIRKSDAALDTVEDIVDKMDEALTGIVKHYPPFPPGSEERIKRLENFSAFRKEIERLTFPPDPFRESTNGSETGETEPSVPQFSFPRMEDLDIPDLSAGDPEATDEEIETALESLEKAKGLVDEKRQALKDGAEKVFETTDPYPATGFDTRPLDDNTAIEESQNLLSFLKGNDSGLTQSSKQLSDLLE